MWPARWPRWTATGMPMAATAGAWSPICAPTRASPAPPITRLRVVAPDHLGDGSGGAARRGPRSGRRRTPVGRAGDPLLPERDRGDRGGAVRVRAGILRALGRDTREPSRGGRSPEPARQLHPRGRPDPREGRSRGGSAPPPPRRPLSGPPRARLVRTRGHLRRPRSPRRPPPGRRGVDRRLPADL